MRILADENCPRDLVDALREQEYDVVWIKTDTPGVKDVAILARAQTKERVILTFDKDFGELAFRHQLPAQSGIILCRLHGLPPAKLIRIVLTALGSQSSGVGLFAVITNDRIRIVPLAQYGRGLLAVYATGATLNSLPLLVTKTSPHLAYFGLGRSLRVRGWIRCGVATEESGGGITSFV